MTAVLVGALGCADGGALATAPADTELSSAGAPGSDAQDDKPIAAANKSAREVEFRFGMRGLPTEDFVATTSDEQVISRARAQLLLPESSRNLHINGLISGARKKANLDWSWQHTNSRWDVVEVSIDVCDGRPSYVEANLQPWLDEIGQFCPKGSYVKSEVTKGKR